MNINESILLKLDKLSKTQKKYFVTTYLESLRNFKIKLKPNLKQKILMLIFKKYLKKAMNGTIMEDFERSLKLRKPVEDAENELEKMLIMKANELDRIPLENKELYFKLLNLSKIINSNILILKETPSFGVAKDLFRNHLSFLNAKIEITKIIMKKGKVQKELQKIHLAYNRSKKIPLEIIIIDLVEELNSETPGWKTGNNLGENLALENEPKRFARITLTKEMLKINPEKIKQDKKILLEILYQTIKQ